MPVENTFQYSTIDGQPVIDLHDWVATLDPMQQQEFREAESRQQALRQSVINQGHMYMDNNGSYIWKDWQAFKDNKPYDPIWLAYWKRWLDENSIFFNPSTKEI